MSAMLDIPGGQALVNWFGQVPRFHDGELLELTLRGAGRGTGLLRIHAWTMTDKVDADGYFILDKHAVVVLSLDGVSRVDCTDFGLVPAIIQSMTITKADERFCIAWESSYGVEGVITAQTTQIYLQPGKPGPA